VIEAFMAVAPEGERPAPQAGQDGGEDR